MFTEVLRNLDAWVVVAVMSAAWVAIGVLSSIGAGRLGRGFLQRETWITRERAVERSGRLYERLNIRRWKDRLPETAGVGAGGTSKRHLAGASSEALADFAAETRRAEYVHWSNIGAGPLFVVVLPVPAAAAVAGLALVAHLPFIMVQRYNRIRVRRVLARGRPDRAAPQRERPRGTQSCGEH